MDVVERVGLVEGRQQIGLALGGVEALGIDCACGGVFEGQQSDQRAFRFRERRLVQTVDFQLWGVSGVRRVMWSTNRVWVGRVDVRARERGDMVDREGGRERGGGRQAGRVETGGPAL